MSPRAQPNGALSHHASGIDRLLVWQLGRVDRAEFKETVQLLRDSARVLSWESWTKLPQQTTLQQTPDLIVLLQSFAGEFASTRLAAVQRAFPLAQVICVLGSYSEGETRSGHPLPRAHRVFWYNAAARLQSGFAACYAGRRPWWSLPDTMNDEERWLARLAEPPIQLSGPIAVFAAVPSLAEPTMDLLRQAGGEPQFVGPHEQLPSGPFSCAVWDASPASRFSPLPLEAAVQSVAPAPLLAMFTFPRTQDVAFAQTAGAVRTLPKLLGADILCWHLDQLTRANGLGQAPTRDLRIHSPAA